jgi:hypothetical protein
LSQCPMKLVPPRAQTPRARASPSRNNCDWNLNIPSVIRHLRANHLLSFLPFLPFLPAHISISSLVLLCPVMCYPPPRVYDT